MALMQLYKNRDFGSLFNDSFGFLKGNFKHLYSNLLKIIGIPLIVLIIFMYLGSRYYEIFFMNVVDQFSYDIESVPGGWPLAIVLIGLFMLVFLIVSVIVYAFTPIYFLLYKDHGQQFNAKDIIRTMVRFKWKILKFVLTLFALTMVVVFALSMLFGVMISMFSGGGAGGVFLGLFFLIMLAVLFSMIVILPYILLSIHNAFLEYLSTDAGLWECLGFGFRLTRSSFWKNVGSVMVYTLLIRIVLSIVLSIPFYIFIFAGSMTNLDDPSSLSTGLMSLLFWQYAVQIISEYFIAPMLQINTSMVYFSNIESASNMSSFDELDQIGKM